MATKIEWTDETWNPVTGCTPAGAGCVNCYAKAMTKRFWRQWGCPQDDPFRVTLHPERLDQPKHWRKPRRVFVCSMGDLFHKDVPDEFLGRVFRVIEDCPQHTFQVLTRRVARMKTFFASRRLDETNLWIGFSASRQETFEKRLSKYVQYRWRCECKFVSLEPLLAPINLQEMHELDWVIVGCDSGPRRSNCELAWLRDIVKQCKAKGTPCFVKQIPVGGRVSHDPSEWPADFRIQEWPTSKGRWSCSQRRMSW